MTVSSGTEVSAPSALADLRAALAGRPPLAALNPDDYAVDHALFEARSDQREQLSRWLETRLAARSARPNRVLSIGTGDGSVDVRVAHALAAGGHRVAYEGVEPHAPSGRAFLDRLAGVPGVEPTTTGTPFGGAPDAVPAGGDVGLTAGYDVILAVHSLYYVPDLRVALERARALLAPGGVLVVLHAPREQLNQLIGLLTPGHPQEFSESVEAALAAVEHERVRIDATLDLSPGGDPDQWHRVLDFAVQAVVPPDLRPLVLAALTDGAPAPVPASLSAAASAGAGARLVPHPVDAFVVPAPA